MLGSFLANRIYPFLLGRRNENRNELVHIIIVHDVYLNVFIVRKLKQSWETGQIFQWRRTAQIAIDLTQCCVRIVRCHAAACSNRTAPSCTSRDCGDGNLRSSHSHICPTGCAGFVASQTKGWVRRNGATGLAYDTWPFFESTFALGIILHEPFFDDGSLMVKRFAHRSVSGTQILVRRWTLAKQ